MEYHINESEYRFMEVLWEVGPASSMELVRICEKRLNWKKSTTYTVIRNLSEKQAVCNDHTTVRPLVSRESMQKQESHSFLTKRFGGSLPSFLMAYLKDRKLTKEEALRLQKLIQDAAEDGMQ
ncbi:MAG: BlaI/MecI/CopY family transcriptional regulator [Eubacterium sp.]|nr:BlaI/MecI/CopY family transcriptional regulator [Eubacterium sp.]